MLTDPPRSELLLPDVANGDGRRVIVSFRPTIGDSGLGVLAAAAESNPLPRLGTLSGVRGSLIMYAVDDGVELLDVHVKTVAGPSVLQHHEVLEKVVEVDLAAAFALLGALLKDATHHTYFFPKRG